MNYCNEIMNSHDIKSNKVSSRIFFKENENTEISRDILKEFIRLIEIQNFIIDKINLFNFDESDSLTNNGKNSQDLTKKEKRIFMKLLKSEFEN